MTTKRDRYSTTELPGEGEEGEQPAPFPRAENILPQGSGRIPRRVDVAQLQEELQRLKEQLEARGSSLVAVQDGNLVVHDFQLTPTGLIAPETMTEESWTDLGHLLFRLEGSIQWLIGDWLVYGAELQYGDITQIAQAMGRDPTTFIEYAHVCRKVQLLVRTNTLSYSHHKMVAPYKPEDQRGLLDYAAENGLSLRQFRAWLDSMSQKVIPARTDKSVADPVAVTRQLNKFFKRDPSTYNQDERQEARNYIEHMERVFAEWKAKL